VGRVSTQEVSAGSPTVGEALAATRARLATSRESASLESEVLLAHTLDRTRSWVLAHPEARLDPSEKAALQAAVDRLASGEPLPYILGHWEFFGRSFEVGPDVLIPRPETELLVERALELLRGRGPSIWALDIGTGCGCIAVTLAAESPGLRVIATDLSPGALRVARRNAIRHGVEGRVRLVRADLLPPGERRFDLVCANLPYIPTGALSALNVARHEPRLALDGGEGGLPILHRLVDQLPGRLAPGGLVLMEIDPGQADPLTARLRLRDPAFDVSVVNDLAGRERLLVVRS
jgi:release factor glutamine methyltransferase